MLSKLVIKISFLLFFSFLFYFVSSLFFFSEAKACNETCYRDVDYCYSPAFRDPIQCDSTESCEYTLQGSHTCSLGEIASYLEGSCEYDPDCEAQPPEPDCECTSGSCCDGCNFLSADNFCNGWSEYYCEWGTDCGSDVGKTTYTQYCSGNSASCNGRTEDSGWTVFQDCQPWETCSQNSQSCICSGACLKEPTLTSPANNTKNVLLPITFNWNAVLGAKSYRYEIGTIQGVTVTPSVIIKDCILKSNTSYTWRVQACCDIKGNNCSSLWSDTWNFKTSLAPELLSPINNAVNVSIPVTLDWCNVDEALSYYVMTDKNGVFYYPFPVEKENNILDSETTFGPDTFTKNTTYGWKIATCLTEDSTKCGIEADCSEDQEGNECGDYSQRWSFTTGEITLPVPEITSPSAEGTPAVNLSSNLSWKPIGIEGVNSYRYEIKQGANIVASSYISAFFTSVSFEDFWEDLDFDETYTATVKSCWDEEGKTCEEEGGEVDFKTTGAPPTNLNESPTDNGSVLIPAKLDWDDMPGAASYYYEISSAVGTIKNSEVSIDYPVLKQKTTYDWQVKTCADKEGEVCGDWSKGSFTTLELTPPINPDPEDGGELLTSESYLNWEGITKFYQYRIDYQGEEKIPLTIVSSKSAFLSTAELELGEYTWYIQSCLDGDCQETSGFAGPWRFNLIEPVPSGEKGLIPCGRYYDDPDTPYNEREQCQFKHFFLLIKNILDFILWRIGLIVLVLLVLAVAVVYYFSMGAPETMVKVKSIVGSAAKGYAVIFLAWLIINVILAILGYQIEFFGRWWQINF